MDTPNDYYAVLGLDPQASAGAIKTAFKKLALQYHPDVYKGMDAEERMRGILQAYRILSDPEARKEYDAQRSNGSVSARREGVLRQERASAKHEQGRFAFPDLRQTPTSTFSLALDGIAYQLSSAQAESLKWDGLVRGLMSNPSGSASGASYVCQRCHHRWSAAKGARPVRPSACPECHAGDWDEFLLLRCTHCEAVFASQEIRDPLRGNMLYHPYELFPLCPHCRRSQWCPAENGRVNALRAAAARRAALLWSCVIGVCALLIVILAFLLLRS